MGNHYAMPLVTRQKLNLSDGDWWLDFTRDKLDGAILREKVSFKLILLYDNAQLIEVKVSSRAQPLSGDQCESATGFVFGDLCQ